MPEKDDKLTTYLLVVLAIVIIITFVLAGLYFSSLKKTNSPVSRTGGSTGNTQVNKAGSANKPADAPADIQNVSTLNTATEFTGYIQELGQKTREIDGVTYNYVIGLLGKDGGSIPIWLTDLEYSNIKAYDARRIRKEIALTEIKGGTYVRVTSRALPEGREVILEIID